MGPKDKSKHTQTNDPEAGGISRRVRPSEPFFLEGPRLESLGGGTRHIGTCKGERATTGTTSDTIAVFRTPEETRADQIVAMATDTDVRAGRAHPETELVAAAEGSEGTRVKLRVTNVYTSSEFANVALQATDTVADLKKLLEGAFASRPAPNEQRLIFRGKQCEERQQLGHILRGVRWRSILYNISYNTAQAQTTTQQL